MLPGSAAPLRVIVTVALPEDSRIAYAAGAQATADLAASVIESVHELIEPASSGSSSTTYSCQIPFGFVPLNTDNAPPGAPGGAGAGKTSPLPSSTFVGRKVPPTIGSGSGAAASSLNATAVVESSGAPPTSDISITACPRGPTSMASMSSGASCVSRSRTHTWPTARVSPETAIADG